MENNQIQENIPNLVIQNQLKRENNSLYPATRKYRSYSTKNHRQTAKIQGNKFLQSKIAILGQTEQKKQGISQDVHTGEQKENILQDLQINNAIKYRADQLFGEFSTSVLKSKKNLNDNNGLYYQQDSSFQNNIYDLKNLKQNNIKLEKYMPKVHMKQQSSSSNQNAIQNIYIGQPSLQNQNSEKSLNYQNQQIYKGKSDKLRKKFEQNNGNPEANLAILQPTYIEQQQQQQMKKNNRRYNSNFTQQISSIQQIQQLQNDQFENQMSHNSVMEEIQKQQYLSSILKNYSNLNINSNKMPSLYPHKSKQNSTYQQSKTSQLHNKIEKQNNKQKLENMIQQLKDRIYQVENKVLNSNIQENENIIRKSIKFSDQKNANNQKELKQLKGKLLLGITQENQKIKGILNAKNKDSEKKEENLAFCVNSSPIKNSDRVESQQELAIEYAQEKNKKPLSSSNIPYENNQEEEDEESGDKDTLQTNLKYFQPQIQKIKLRSISHQIEKSNQKQNQIQQQSFEYLQNNNHNSNYNSNNKSPLKIKQKDVNSLQQEKIFQDEAKSSSNLLNHEQIKIDNNENKISQIKSQLDYNSKDMAVKLKSFNDKIQKINKMKKKRKKGSYQQQNNSLYSVAENEQLQGWGEDEKEEQNLYQSQYMNPYFQDNFQIENYKEKRPLNSLSFVV